MTNELTVAAKSEMQVLAETIERLAVSTDVDPAKLQAILDVQERIMNKRAAIALNQSMAAISAKIPPVPKNGKISLGGKGSIPFMKYEDMMAALNPLLADNGLALSFDTEQREGGGFVVKATLMHEGGGSRSVSFALPLDGGAARNNLQAAGSTLSYGQRYCVKMLFNIVHSDEDDDGYAGGAAFISEAQVNELHALLKETGTDLALFMDKGMGMDGKELTDIQVKDFAKAKNALLTKKARLAGAK